MATHTPTAIIGADPLEARGVIGVLGNSIQYFSRPSLHGGYAPQLDLGEPLFRVTLPLRYPVRPREMWLLLRVGTRG